MIIADIVIREYLYESAKPLSIVTTETRLKYIYEVDSYMYSNDGVKGWVNAPATTTNTNITINDKPKVYKSTDRNSGLADFTLPSGTTINFIYRYGYRNYYYIEYEGKSVGYMLMNLYHQLVNMKKLIF